MAFYEILRANFEFPDSYTDFFDHLPNRVELLSKWFLTEYDVFKGVFFAPSFCWTNWFLFAFFSAQGTKLPLEMTPAQIMHFLKTFNELMLDIYFDYPALEKRIFNKCREYVSVYALENHSLYERFMIRFNPKYICTVDQFAVIDKDLVILTCLGGKWKVTVELLKRLDKSEYWPFYFLARPKLFMFFLKNDPSLYRRLIGRLPDELYTDSSAIQDVLKFYRARDISSLLESLWDIKAQEAMNLVYFINLFGNLNNFSATLNLLPELYSSDILNIIIKLKDDSRQRDEDNTHDIVALKILIGLPEALKVMYSFTRTRIDSDTIEEMFHSEEYIRASEDAKQSIQSLIIHCSESCDID